LIFSFLEILYIHKFHNSLKKNTTNSLSLSHQDSYNFLTMWQKKMKHIKSPEKKISTKVLFMTLYHTATDNSQSNQHQLSSFKVSQCFIQLYFNGNFPEDVWVKVHMHSFFVTSFYMFVCVEVMRALQIRFGYLVPDFKPFVWE
jgi:hypothetical protein